MNPRFAAISRLSNAAVLARMRIEMEDRGGRLDMILLHLVLVLRQLSAPHGALPPAGQGLFDRFCRDMDANFREMGVGDLAVPKRMQKIGEAFYGRSKAYEDALGDANPAALESAVRYLANDLGPEGIRVNSVAPGLTMTDIHDRSTGDVGRIDRLRPHVPMQRIGEPEEIAQAVLFLASKEASFVNGVELFVDGGQAQV